MDKNELWAATLKAQVANIAGEAANVERVLEKRYPNASRVEVFLSEKQRVPTPAEVLCVGVLHYGYALPHLRCRMLVGTGLVRDVPLDKVVGSGYAR